MKGGSTRERKKEGNRTGRICRLVKTNRLLNMDHASPYLDRVRNRPGEDRPPERIQVKRAWSNGGERVRERNASIQDGAEGRRSNKGQKGGIG